MTHEKTARRKEHGALALAVALLLAPLVVAAVQAASYRAHNANSGTLISSGEAREFLLHVPPQHDAEHPVPLVLSLHGGAGWPALQRDHSGWNDLADEHGFLVAYPEGTLHELPIRGWRVLEDGHGLQRDVQFISDLIDHLVRTWNVDPDRVYVNGLSNGGAMSFVLSCALAPRLAGVGIVGAAYVLPFEWCARHDTATPIPVVAFHGTDDSLAPYEGGTSWAVPHRMPSIPSWMQRWAERHTCEGKPRVTRIAEDVVRTSWGDCARGATVSLHAVEGGGHTWPGGPDIPVWFLGRTTHSVSATEIMWELFESSAR